MPPLSPFSKTCIAAAIAHSVAAPLQAATITVNTLEDPRVTVNTCSLRDAINSANDEAKPAGSNCVDGFEEDTIAFTGLSGEITLSSTLPTVESNITLQGPGQENLTISGDGAHGILYAKGASATLTIDSLTLFKGSAAYGGAVYASYSPSLSINNSTLTSNSAGFGAAVYVYESPNLSINNSTLSGNFAQDNGGAVHTYYYEANLSVSISNSTLSGNSTNNQGGAVSTEGFSNLSIINSLLTGNSATTNNGSEIYLDSYSTIIIDTHNIFGNSSQTFAKALYNFIPTATSIVATSTDADANANPDAKALNAILGPLADNGGPTLTHGLVANSPALDAGNQILCTDNDITHDQRGEPRDDGLCDIGAFEGLGIAFEDPGIAS
ncbi:MAG: CSLREA domain-containing protein [Gammaproteobacteria bacterium]|jgi:CSLREA domain-containing protein